MPESYQDFHLTSASLNEMGADSVSMAGGSHLFGRILPDMVAIRVSIELGEQGRISHELEQ